MSAVKSIVDEVVAVDGSDTPAGGAATPGGDPGQLQYHGADGALAGVPNSSASADTFEVYAGDPNGATFSGISLNGQGQVTVAGQLPSGAYGEMTYVAGSGDGFFRTRTANVDESAISAVVVQPTSVEITAGDGTTQGTSRVTVNGQNVELSATAGIFLRALGVYADNAAALADGLVADQVYRTPAGVLMVVYTP